MFNGLAKRVLQAVHWFNDRFMLSPNNWELTLQHDHSVDGGVISRAFIILVEAILICMILQTEVKCVLPI